jgi:hypothetical protein
MKNEPLLTQHTLNNFILTPFMEGKNGIMTDITFTGFLLDVSTNAVTQWTSINSLKNFHWHSFQERPSQ